MPQRGACNIGSKLQGCVLMLDRDFERLVIALKACCLAVGGTAADCQAGP